GDMISPEQIDEDYQFALEEAEVDMTLEEYYELRAEGGDEHTEIAEKISEFAGSIVEQNPIGTGYLEFDSRTPGESTSLTGNEEYWAGEVNIYELSDEGVDEHTEIAETISECAGSIVEQNPIGTGYLEFDSRTPAESTSLTGNEEYWAGDVNIDKLTLKVVPETGSRIAEIETG